MIQLDQLIPVEEVVSTSNWKEIGSIPEKVKRTIRRRKINKNNITPATGGGACTDALRSTDGDILTQIGIARKFQKPFFIAIDKKLSNEDVKEIYEYFSNDNIIKKMTIDLHSHISLATMATEIKKLVREFCGTDEKVQIITPHSHEDPDKESEEKKEKK